MDKEKKNKQNKIVIIIVALILVMAVGYAIFNQTINITGTAVAEGSFKIDVECNPGISNDLRQYGVDLGFTMYEDNGYSNDYCRLIDGVYTFHTDLNSPGAARYFTIKMKNSGSIDAVLDTANDFISLKNEYCSDGSDGSTKNGLINHETECGGTHNIYGELINGYAIADPDDNIIPFSQASQFFEGNKIILRPGYSIYSVDSEYFDSNAEISGLYYESHEVSVRYIFRQAQ